MSSYDYSTDQLTPEERESRIVAAILELERNPNASRRGVARNHGLPESTLRGRMKKLKISYKNFNKDDRVTRREPSYEAGPAVGQTFSPKYNAINNATTTSQNLIYAQYYLQQNLQAERQNSGSQGHGHHQQQAERSALSTTVPTPYIPPYKAPPLAQFNLIEYNSKNDRGYLAEELLEDSRELKPTTINTPLRKLVQVKIAKSNLLKFDDYKGANRGMCIETSDDPDTRQKKIDKCVEELARSPYMSMRDVSLAHQIPQSAIKRSLEIKKDKLVEYEIPKQTESRILEILQQQSMIQDVEYLRTMVHELIDEFIKSDFYSENSDLKEMLDKERREEITSDFLWKYSNVLVGGIRLHDLIDV